MRGTLSFRNNLSVPVSNAIVEAVFSGEGLDERTIRVPGGSYRATTKSAVWNASSAEILRQLNPNQSGTFELEFSFLNPIPVRSSRDKNLTIVLEAVIRPGVIPPGFSGADLTGRSRAEAKLQTELQLARRGLYYSALIPNSGPLPPQVGKETTFTVTWSLINSTNDIEGLQVRSSLPSHLGWKGIIEPKDEALEFNPATGDLVWNVGTVKAGEGFLRPARQVAFQIGFIPGPNHIGFSPLLVSRVSAKGRDTFTGLAVRSEAAELTLDLRDDPKIQFDQTRVVP